MTVPYPNQAPYPSQPQYGQQIPGYAYAPPAPVVRSKALGMTAMITGIVVFVLSIIASVLIGIGEGALIPDVTGDFSTAFNEGYYAAADNPALQVYSVYILIHFSLGTLFGTSAVVAGIVATATIRGRAQGVVAIVVAGIAPFVSFAVWIVCLQIGVSS